MALNQKRKEEIANIIEQVFTEGVAEGLSAEQIIGQIQNNQEVISNVPYLRYDKDAKYIPGVEKSIDNSLREVLIAERKAKRQHDEGIGTAPNTAGFFDYLGPDGYFTNKPWYQDAKEIAGGATAGFLNCFRFLKLKQPHPRKAYRIVRDNINNNYKTKKIDSLSELVDANRNKAKGIVDNLELAEDCLEIAKYMADACVKNKIVKLPGDYDETRNGHDGGELNALESKFSRQNLPMMPMQAVPDIAPATPHSRGIDYARHPANRDHQLTPITERQRQLMSMVALYHTKAADAYDALNTIHDALENARANLERNLMLRRDRPERIPSMGAGDYVPKP